MNPNTTEKEIFEIYLDDIIPNRFQPRLVFDETGLKELAASIKEHGIIQPLVVRKLGDKYEIIAGERRYKASMMAGLKKVPVIVMDLNDRESAEVAVVENLQRRDLTPLEEAKSYKKLLDKNYLTQEQLAKNMGKNQATISNKLRLLNLDESVQEALLNEKISERHARSLLSLRDPNEQRKILNDIITNKLTVKQTDDMIKSMTANQNMVDPSIVIREPEVTMSVTPSNISTNNIFESFKQTSTEPTKTIPSMPMPAVEITEPVQPVSSIIGEPFNFVDLDKIKAEATDINVQKPLVDINTLLKSSTEKQEEVNSNVEVKQPTIDVEKPKNRFLPSLEDEETNMDFFEELDIPEIPKIEPVQTVIEKPKQDVISSVEQQTPVTPIITTPVIEEVAPITMPETMVNNIPVVPVVPVNTYEIPAVYEDDEDDTPVQPIVSQQSYGFSIRDAIASFRDAARKVEGNGFVLDLDEYDMDNEYQITIKINKNKK